MKPWLAWTGSKMSRTALVSFAAVGCCLVLSGCNLIDAALGRHAKIEKMVPGGNVATGGLDCWLTLNFATLPDGVDLTDVKVRFESEALLEPAEFDWAYIASHDFLAAEAGKFGAGNIKADHTAPGRPPELGRPTKARFPLKARSKIQADPDQIWLHATLYWGGKKQHSYKRNIAHVYESSPGSFF